VRAASRGRSRVDRFVIDLTPYNLETSRRVSDCDSHLSKRREDNVCGLGRRAGQLRD